jgi:hypothetical protein
MLAQADPVRSKHLARTAQADADARWQLYEQIAGVQRNLPENNERDDSKGDAAAAAPAPKEMEQ